MEFLTVMLDQRFPRERRDPPVRRSLRVDLGPDARWRAGTRARRRIFPMQ